MGRGAVRGCDVTMHAQHVGGMLDGIPELCEYFVLLVFSDDFPESAHSSA